MGHVPSVARVCLTNYNGSLNTTTAGDIDDIIYNTHSLHYVYKAPSKILTIIKPLYDFHLHDFLG